MAAASLPKSYPGSYPESIPPTPDETMQQPVQSEQHHERNKLLKPGDPRRHKHTDSGIGMTGPGLIQPSIHKEPNWHGPNEAVGGGTYVRDYAQPAGPPESTRTNLNTATTSAQHTESERFSHEEPGRHSAAAMMGGVSTAGSGGAEGSKPADRDHQASGDTAPYWGDRPSGANGAVHNTVAGHGSAIDDHAEHHHLPSKSTPSEKSIIAGGVAKYPRGGVYNTVTGHGSQDQEAARHSQPRDIDIGNNMAGVVAPVNDTMPAAPLPDIPEERQKPNHKPTLLVETAVRDHALPAEAASRDAEHYQTLRSPEVAAPRAFPLVGATVDSSNDQRKSTSSSKYGAAAAGAAALGVGAAASGYAGQQRGRSDPPDETTGHSTSHGPDNRHKTAGGAVTGERQPQGSQQSSPVEKSTSHGEESPKGEKKHGILGIFHRNKNEGRESTHRKSFGDRAEHTQEATTTVTPSHLPRLSKGESAMGARPPPSSAKAGPEEHAGHSKEMAGAGAAAGAVGFGFLHHLRRNSASEKHENAASTTLHPRSAENSGAGPAGETLPVHQAGQVSTPFEHPRERPIPPPEAERQSGNYNVLAAGTPSGISQGAQTVTKGTTTNEPRNYNTLASGTASGINANRSGITRKDVASSDSGGYNVLGSSGRSPVAEGALNQSGETVTQEPGHYNTLASGIPSGIGRDSSAAGIRTGDRNTTTDNSKEEEEPTEYNVLPSGTVSGVKVKPKSPRHSSHSTDAAISDDSQRGPGQHNTLASGAALGVSRASQAPQAASTTDSRAQAVQNLPATTYHDPTAPQQEQHTFPNGAPIPSHLLHERAHPNASQESVPGITSYAHPDMDTVPHPHPQHTANPEVMPDAYPASAAHAPPAQQQAQAQATQGQGYAAQEQGPAHKRTALGMGMMGAAAVPAAYTAATAGGPQQQQHQLEKQQLEREQPLDDKRFNPALAAATTSWAAAGAGGKSGMVGERGRDGYGGGVGRQVARFTVF
ncbi:hypothetical protein B0I37DRAFT_407194 [Chaetomium sp. MPI-CAGE-AT-0009]|nr:hypothetical protein B0I37DRAFT_407194 [Chaetomium sp. MPI-CAGE-AT-0009]